MKRRKIITGIYGGSFNPIHLGHVRLGETLVRDGLMDELWLLVSPQNPFKADQDLLADDERLRLARLAVSGHPKLQVCDAEFRMPRPSYMVHTLEAMRRIILSHEAILGIHDMIIYNYGPGQYYATFHAEVDAAMDFMKAHDAIDHIERELHDELGIRVTCHMDPIMTNDSVMQALRKRVEDSLREFDMIEGFHDLRYSSSETDPDRKFLSMDVAISPGSHYSEKEITASVRQAAEAVLGPCEIALEFDQAYTVK